MTWRDAFNASATGIIIIMLITLGIVVAICYGDTIVDIAHNITPIAQRMADIAQHAIETIIKGDAPDWAAYHIIIKVDDTITFNEFCEHRVYALGNVVCTQPQGIIVYHIPDGAYIVDRRGK